MAGIADENGFERFLSRRCEVHAFDCTVPPSTATATSSGKYQFHRVCLGRPPGNLTELDTSAASNQHRFATHSSSHVFEPLHKLMRKYGHRTIDLLSKHSTLYSNSVPTLMRCFSTQPLCIAPLQQPIRAEPMPRIRHRRSRMEFFRIRASAMACETRDAPRRPCSACF